MKDLRNPKDFTIHDVKSSDESHPGFVRGVAGSVTISQIFEKRIYKAI